MLKIYYLTSLLTFSLLLGCYTESPSRTTPTSIIETTTLPPIAAEIDMPTYAATVPSQPIQPTYTSTPSPTPTNPPKQLPSPKNTPTYTPTSLPSLTPTPVFPPTKPIFIAFGLFGGDGGSPYLDYLGRNTPSLILYTDGQMLIREGRFEHASEGYIYQQGTLAPDEMCSLFLAIEKTGFFEVEANGFQGDSDPIYEFDDSVQFSEGGPTYRIHISGPRPKKTYIYFTYVPYLIDEVRATYDLLSSYPLSDTTVYQPNQVVLWIEEDNGEEEKEVQSWPDYLPPLLELITSVDYATFEGAVIQENVDSLLQLFDNRMTSMSFSEDGKQYRVIARPLLPHETPLSFIWWPHQVAEFPLPFECLAWQQE